jgi:hypothetical protein
MIVLYTAFVALLAAAHLLVRWRVAYLERQYAKAAKAADEALRQTVFKEGNSNRPDALQQSKRQYLLGRLAERRDAVEARYTRWQTFGERLGRLVARVRGWKGRKLPYTFGVLDVVGALTLIDALGVGQYVSAHALTQLVMTWLHR